MSHTHNIPEPHNLSYKDAGVDIQEGDRLVSLIRKEAKATLRPGVLAGIGGFGALFELPWQDYQQPVLVSSTDGVGTKLKLAQELKRHDTIGIDLVAMCVNDIITSGAEPLFFLDYFATGRLDAKHAATIIAGIARGCKLAKAALVGGETAEMPGMYQGEDYDLAGFCVGLVEKSRIIDGSHIQPGDVLIALASTGPHANGYSLIRKIIEMSNTDLSQGLGHTTLGETLLQPTRIYVETILSLQKQHNLLGIAHITGGGIPGNLPRILPESVTAVIDQSSWDWPPIFDWLQTTGGIEKAEMLRTFNCGVGMILVVREEAVHDCLASLAKCQETAWRIGHIKPRMRNEPAIEYV